MKQGTGSREQGTEKPVCIDLYCGLGGWSEAFLAEGYECRGYDIEAHDYGTGGYPGTLILRDVRSIHGSECKDAAVIVASPPCQGYSYRAMPWKRAKTLPPPDNTLFNECFRIQREASEAARHYIPLIVENVRGAQKWVGRARWNYGSFYLWGDVPALMPMTFKAFKSSGMNWSDQTKRGQDFTRIAGKQAFQSCAVEETGVKMGSNPGKRWEDRPASVAAHREKTMCAAPEIYGDRDEQGIKQHGSGAIWYRTGNGALPSKSPRRKAASAMIAKIPYPLALHIARCFKPVPCSLVPSPCEPEAS
ncbi:MAG: DNA cytosine methyltransferase [Terracidiphilus sp.]